jgi:hypothetical protein
MKKKLEADLISIAHRILQLKNKSDVNQLYLETQKLYEKLAVLRFVEDHFGDTKPTIGLAEMDQKIAILFEEPNTIEPEKNIIIPASEQANSVSITIENPTEPIVIERIIDNSLNQTNEELPTETLKLAEEDTTPIDSSSKKSIIDLLIDTEDFDFSAMTEYKEPQEKENFQKEKTTQISLEDFLGKNYNNTLFVKLQDNETNASLETAIQPTEISIEKNDPVIETVSPENLTYTKPISLNDKLAKGIHFDLNDRIAFIKHLFGNSEEEYNRVISQIMTFDTYTETQNFIDEMVKPDYNNWDGKEDYSRRFQEIIAKKFA